MDYETREYLATEFAGVMKTVREEKWESLSDAARQTGLGPYLAIARLLVRIVEEIADRKAGNHESN